MTEEPDSLKIGDLRRLIRIEIENIGKDKFRSGINSEKYLSLNGELTKLAIELKERLAPLNKQWGKIAVAPLFELYSSLYYQTKIGLPDILESCNILPEKLAIKIQSINE